MKTTVKERLILFAKTNGLSQKAFERKAGLSNGYINNISKGIGAEKLQKILSTFPQLNEGWLISGEGEMLKDASPAMQPDTNGIPLIPVNAVGGVLSGVSDSFLEYDCERYIVPQFSGADFLIRVVGDSMMPKYIPGDIVACKRVTDRIWFQWGKTYVVDTRQGVLIKRIEPSDNEGCITLRSENDNYKPFDLPADELHGVAIVGGLRYCHVGRIDLLVLQGDGAAAEGTAGL